MGHREMITGEMTAGNKRKLFRKLLCSLGLCIHLRKNLTLEVGVGKKN